MSGTRPSATGADDTAAIAQVVRSCTGREVRGLHLLTGGLALRRFHRVTLDGPPHTLVARVEAEEDPAGRPAGVPPEPPLEPIRGFLAEAGLPVPASLGRDADLGIDLLEDLGDQALADAPQDTRLAYTAEACALVPRLQSLADPGALPAFARRLDRALFDYKAALFSRVSLPLALGREPTRAETARVAEAFGVVADRCERAPMRLAHRDFQSHNLRLAPGERGGPLRLVMIDLQGAFLAPPEYDLVCLLRDSYAETPEPVAEELLDGVRPQLPDAPDAEVFAERFDLLTLTRKGKDHARYLDVARRRGDASHVAYVSAAAHALRAASTRVAHLDASLRDLRDWIHALPEEPSSCAR